MIQKTKRPADAAASAGPREIDHQLGSEKISPTNTPKPAELQAPDERGEDDLTYFVRRPGLLERTRFPFVGEFLVEPAWVHIRISRSADGWPMRKARRHLHFCEGGRA